MSRKTRVKKQYENKSYHEDETMDLERFAFRAVLSFKSLMIAYIAPMKTLKIFF